VLLSQSSLCCSCLGVSSAVGESVLPIIVDPRTSCARSGPVEIRGRLRGGGNDDVLLAGEGLRRPDRGLERGELLEVEGLFLWEWKAPLKMSALRRREKLARPDARLEAVEADQRLRLRRLSFRPVPLLDRERPLLCSLAESGTLGAGRGSLNGSRRSGGASIRVGSPTTIRAGGKRDAVRGGLAATEAI